MTRADLVAQLVALGLRRDRASMYADLVVTYREAAAHVGEHGSVVQHPRTASPMPNPYLSIRDAAMTKLLQFRGLPQAVEDLWR